MNLNKNLIKLYARVELARRNFWQYCKLKAPDFYKEDSGFLRDFCNELQQFIKSDDEVMVVNMPPRHGKSRTVGNFVEWVLGNDQTQKIMTGSYNETLSTTFSKGVRNTILETKADENKAVYSDVFPGVTIKRGDGAMNMWSLENGYNNYLATSPTGTATGFGATLMIIDDLIKSALEANNANILDNHWTWFTDTMMSRLEEGGKIIIVMTRWHSLDLAGRALEHFKSIGVKVRHICYKAVKKDGTMLCPEILSKRSYENKKMSMGIDIAEANYQQNPIDIKGRMYTSFKTYREVPQFKQIRNYTDTADEGKDYLCSINYGVTFDNEAYVLDLIYTQEPMEVTEPLTAKLLFDGNVNVARIESNNGGRGFARSVKRILQEELKSNKTVIKWFTQHNNKNARIFSNSAWVMQHIYFPEDWKNRWPDYYKAMSRYQREGKNDHDDAQDATTGIAEDCAKKSDGLSVLK